MGTVGPAHARAGADAPALGLVRWGGRGAGVVGTHGPERPCGLREDEPYRIHAMVRLIMHRPEIASGCCVVLERARVHAAMC